MERGSGDVAGWLVVLDASTWCVECAPDRAAARQLWGVNEDSPDVLVGAVNEALARSLGCTCRRCGRRLSEVSGG